MFCTDCAAPIPLAAANCTACGSRAAPVPYQTARPTPGAHPGSRPRRRALRGLYLLPIALLLVAGGWLFDARRDLRVDAAASYQRGTLAAAAGRLDEAAAAFAAAGDFRDADSRRRAAEAGLAPLRDAYRDGIAAAEAGDLGRAIERFRLVAARLPSYEDSHLRLADVRRQKADALRAAADAAEARRDWLAAEHALASLVAVDPGDPAVAERLALLRRDHAPIVLGRDHQLWLVGPDGADERLLTAEVPALWPTWSPDRSHVAFISINTDDPASATAPTPAPALYVVATDGSGLTRLADDIAAHTPPVWSPTGDRLAFASFANYDSNRNEGVIGVHVIDLATGHETDVSGPHLPVAFNPTWSPTGDRLAYISKRPKPGERPQNADGDILIADLATNDQHNLTAGTIPDAWSVHWSPTGDDLLVYSVFGDTWYEPPITGIRLLDAVTGATTPIVSEEGVVTAPVWSPDGSRFAFAHERTSLRIRDLDHREATVAAADQLSGELSWSPTGEAVLAATVDGAQGSLLVAFAADGTPQPRPLGVRFDDDQPFYGSPQWGPLNPAPPPTAPTVAGTGLDPATD